MDSEQPPNFRPSLGGFRWDGVAHQPYKQDGEAPFKDISRQTLFHDDALACELRYFEMDTNGWSSLERHEHAHAVMILRGRGQCMVGDEVRDVKQFDLITIPGWHMAPVPRQRRRAIRFPVHGQHDPRPAGAADRGRHGPDARQPCRGGIPCWCGLEYFPIRLLR